MNTEPKEIDNTQWTYFFGGTVGNVSTRWYKGEINGVSVEKCVTSSVLEGSTKKPIIEYYERGGIKKWKRS